LALETEAKTSTPEQAQRASHVQCLGKKLSAFGLSFVIAMLGNSYDTEDVAQQTLLKGLTGIIGLRRDDQFGVWISRIAGSYKHICCLYGTCNKRVTLSWKDTSALGRSCQRSAWLA